jgi:hypothetical protein
MKAGKKTARRVTHHALVAESIAPSSPELGEPTLTVGQIVERLGPLAPDASTASERIRHWTREGLLIPVSQLHAGTGKPRGYNANSPFTAAVLSALSTAGLQIVSRPYIKTALREAGLALQKWQQAQNAGHKLLLFFLVIVHDMTNSGGEPRVWLREGAVKYDPTAEVAIVINLSQLFTHVRDSARHGKARQKQRLTED